MDTPVYDVAAPSYGRTIQRLQLRGTLSGSFVWELVVHEDQSQLHVGYNVSCHYKLSTNLQCVNIRLRESERVLQMMMIITMVPKKKFLCQTYLNLAHDTYLQFPWMNPLPSLMSNVSINDGNDPIFAHNDEIDSGKMPRLSRWLILMTATILSLSICCLLVNVNCQRRGRRTRVLLVTRQTADQQVIKIHKKFLNDDWPKACHWTSVSIGFD